MGGPWRSREFDPVAWRPPAPHAEASRGAAGADAPCSHLTGIVVGYVISVLALAAVMLTVVIKYGYVW